MPIINGICGAISVSNFTSSGSSCAMIFASASDAVSIAICAANSAFSWSLGGSLAMSAFHSARSFSMWLGGTWLSTRLFRSPALRLCTAASMAPCGVEVEAMAALPPSSFEPHAASARANARANT